jgi:hypothetical protein
MSATLPLFVGRDYSQHAVQLCVLDRTGKVLCNRAVPDSADALDQAVRRLGTVRSAALERIVPSRRRREKTVETCTLLPPLGPPGGRGRSLSVAEG